MRVNLIIEGLGAKAIEGDLIAAQFSWFSQCSEKAAELRKPGALKTSRHFGGQICEGVF